MAERRWPSYQCDKEYVTIQDATGYRIEDAEGNVIVPAGKYELIFGCFSHGYVKVRQEDPDAWALVNEKGEEIWPIGIYNIWNFYKPLYTLPYTCIEPRKGDNCYFVFADGSIRNKKPN